MEVGGQLHISTSLPSGKGSLNPLIRNLGGAHSRHKRIDEQKNICLCRESKLSILGCNFIALLTELCRLTIRNDRNTVREICRGLFV